MLTDNIAHKSKEGFVAFPNRQTRFTSRIASVDIESFAERLKVLTEDQSRYSSRSFLLIALLGSCLH
ncbi:hypothetical protein P8452_32501 [Trifolium repens]|nr:hypothetical protein P8452_32501 [Trifolium repens]